MAALRQGDLQVLRTAVDDAIEVNTVFCNQLGEGILDGQDDKVWAFDNIKDASDNLDALKRCKRWLEEEVTNE
jgi:hypothetical protein